MGAKIYQIIFRVSDIDEAEALYRELLEIRGHRVSPGRHVFEVGAVLLTCYDPKTEGQAQIDFPPNRHPVYFAVPNLELVFERARQSDRVLVDDQIVAQPWGSRYFRAQDPFGNLIAFTDERTAQLHLSERVSCGPEELLRVGLRLQVYSIPPKPTERISASISKIFEEEIWLRLSEPVGSTGFQEMVWVSIQYPAKGQILLADVQILKVSATAPEYMAISVPKTASLLQRRTAPRVQLRLPVEFRLRRSRYRELVSGEIYRATTHDISTGGLRLETGLPLQEEDELELHLAFLPGVVKVRARVIFSHPLTGRGDPINWVGLQFLEVGTEEQIRLLQFLIDRNRKENPRTNGIAYSEIP